MGPPLRDRMLRRPRRRPSGIRRPSGRKAESSLPGDGGAWYTPRAGRIVGELAAARRGLARLLDRFRDHEIHEAKLIEDLKALECSALD